MQQLCLSHTEMWNEILADRILQYPLCWQTRCFEGLGVPSGVWKCRREQSSARFFQIDLGGPLCTPKCVPETLGARSHQSERSFCENLRLQYFQSTTSACTVRTQHTSTEPSIARKWTHFFGHSDIVRCHSYRLKTQHPSQPNCKVCRITVCASVQ